MIYDRNMNKLVNSETFCTTVCLPVQGAVSTIEGSLNENEITTLHDNIKKNRVSVFKTTDVFNSPYVKTAITSERYSESQSCVHLIGHLDENGNGAMGLEKAYDSYLSQITGDMKAIWSTNALGHILTGEEIRLESNNYLSPAGIQLTIDLQLQKITEEALESHNIGKGAAVILNSYTNEILAMASAPKFNPNNVSVDISNPDSPFINRAITSYSVGSVFKPILSACALEKGLRLNYNCVGSINVNNTVFRCSNSNAHGNINMTGAMEESCNCYFIRLAQTINSEYLVSLCSDFGFGKTLELADNFITKAGYIPTVQALNSPEALANLAFGQGDLMASPLQLATAYSCFANGGYYKAPTLMKGIIDERGNTVQRVRLPDSYRILNESTVTKIDEALLSVVKNGNGHKADSTLTENRGKTATAQTGWYENGLEVNHTWFCGYFTAHDTTYTVVILKDDGKSGATDCAPVFKTISDEIYKNNYNLSD